MAKKHIWKNRIVGHASVDPKTLLAHPKNIHNHSKYQKRLLNGVINDLGFIKSVLVNKLTNTIIDGHLRVVMAVEQEQPTISVEYVELTESEETEALLTLDPIARLSEVNSAAVGELVQNIKTNDREILSFLGKIQNDSGMATLLPPPAPVAAPAPAAVTEGGGSEVSTTPAKPDTIKVIDGLTYQSHLKIVRFAKEQVMTADDEIDRLAIELKKYRDRTGTDLGFFKWILSHVPE